MDFQQYKMGAWLYGNERKAKKRYFLHICSWKHFILICLADFFFAGYSTEYISMWALFAFNLSADLLQWHSQKSLSCLEHRKLKLTKWSRQLWLSHCLLVFPQLGSGEKSSHLKHTNKNFSLICTSFWSIENPYKYPGFARSFECPSMQKLQDQDNKQKGQERGS